MTCPRCGIGYNPKKWESCPHCGAAGKAVVSGVMRTSTILISAGADDDGFYRSIEEVPEPLRKLLTKSTSGSNSGTIFIADERGRQEIAKAIRNLPDTMLKARPRRLASGDISIALGVAGARRWAGVAPLWFALLLLAFAAAVVWLVFGRGF